MKMKPQTTLHSTPNLLRTTAPLMQFDLNPLGLVPNFKRASVLRPPCAAAKFPRTGTSLRRTRIPSGAFAAANPHLDTQASSSNLEATEERIEKVIYRCRFMTLLAVLGSLTGSFLCFIKGCTFIVSSFMEYFVDRSKVILLLVEAIGEGLFDAEKLFFFARTVMDDREYQSESFPLFLIRYLFDAVSVTIAIISGYYLIGRRLRLDTYY